MRRSCGCRCATRPADGCSASDPAPERALPLALLAEAMRFAEQGDHRLAIVVADSSVRVLDARVPPSEDSSVLPAWEALGAVDRRRRRRHARTDERRLDGRHQRRRGADRRTIAPFRGVEQRTREHLARRNRDRCAVDDPSPFDLAEIELQRVELLVVIVDVDGDPNLLALLDHWTEADQDSAVGDDDGAVVVRAQGLVAASR